MLISVSDDLKAAAREAGLAVLRAPFAKRTWCELLYLLLGSALAGAAFDFISVTFSAGIGLAITFFGLALVALSLRGARGLAGFQRSLVRNLLGETIEEPQAFAPRPGYLGWLQSVLRDRTGWRSIGYFVVKAPFSLLAFFVALSLWWDAVTCLVFPFTGAAHPQTFGLVVQVFRPGYLNEVNPGAVDGLAVFLTGIAFALMAPWVVRGVVHLDRLLTRALLGPDAAAVRVRSLEHARAHTVDVSAATLRRIERDLHDGTQAQLVALAMRLGMAKEKLASTDPLDLGQVRRLVDDAHLGAKEAITELRDLARGIHPPALDIGLEGALATLTARSTVPADLTVTLPSRPTPAIEAIAYFCVAELLANVAQHADASRVTVSCAQHGQWVRLVVRDDGVGAARLSRVGSSSSGLAGLADRVRSVDGKFDIVSPDGGPTVVTVDLPLHA